MAPGSTLTRLVEACGSIPPHATLQEALEPLLQILADTEDGGMAGVRLLVDTEELRLSCRSRRDVNDLQSGVPPRNPSRPPEVEAMFPEVPAERSEELPTPLIGAVHLAAPRFARSQSTVDGLLRQAASLVALVVRGHGQPARKVDANAHAPADLAQLEKLATIGQTASQIVHELNNPLTAIIAYSDYLTRRMLDRETADGDVDRLLKISEAAIRIQRFCRELTEYSRPAGTLRTRIDLRDVLDSALSFCAHGLRGTEITVERVYGEIPSIEGIDTALTQVFVNLITNAWHAMPNGGTLSLRARSFGTSVVVEVADQGDGIHAADRHRIFDAYFTTKPKGSGVGLGLSIVKQIVIEHRGDIRAEPREPRGTVFVVSFPATAL